MLTAQTTNVSAGSDFLLLTTDQISPTTNLNLKVSMCVCIYQEAAARCEKRFSASLEDRDELLKQMLDWAFGGFQPTGPDRLKPKAATNGRNMNTFTRYFQTAGPIKRSWIQIRIRGCYTVA